jgi:hypothetical protein
MSDIKMLKSWTTELETEIAGLAKTDEILPAKKQLLATILAKLEKAVKDAPTSGSKLPGSDFTRDQLSRLRSSESALSALEFSGRDYDANSKYVATVDKIYDAYISDDASLEPTFVKQVKLSFSDNPYSRLKAAVPPPATWDDLKSWIADNFDSGLVSIQLLARALETEYKKGSDWKSFSTDVDRRMDTAAKAVLKQLRKNKAATTGKKLDDSANNPDVNEVFAFFSAAIVADRLKSHDTAVHALMAQEWRSINCAADIGTKAEFLISQTGKTSTAYLTRQSANSSRSGDKKSKPAKQPDDKNGRKWRERCKFGMDCRQGKQGDCDRYHGPGFKVNNKSDSKVNQKYAAEILALKSKLEAAKSTALPIETSSFFH